MYPKQLIPGVKLTRLRADSIPRACSWVCLWGYFLETMHGEEKCSLVAAHEGTKWRRVHAWPHRRGSLSFLLWLRPGHHKVSGASPLWPGGCHGVLCHHRFKALETNRKDKQPKQTFPPLACFFLAFITGTPHLTNATPCDTYARHSCYGASPTCEVSIHWHFWRLPQFHNDTVSFLRLRPSTVCSSMILGILPEKEKNLGDP